MSRERRLPLRNHFLCGREVFPAPQPLKEDLNSDPRPSGFRKYLRRRTRSWSLLLSQDLGARRNLSTRLPLPAAHTSGLRAVGQREVQVVRGDGHVTQTSRQEPLGAGPIREREERERLVVRWSPT